MIEALEFVLAAVVSLVGKAAACSVTAFSVCPVRACFAAGAVHMRRGEFSRGIQILRHGVELARVRDLPMGTRVLTPILGSGLAHAGQTAEALEILTPVVAAPLLPYCLIFVAEAYLLAGRPDEAAGVAARALEHSTEKKEMGVRTWALWLQALIGAGRAGSDKTAALAHYRQALALAEAREMRPLAAHCRFGLGEYDAARRHYEAMGMTYWAKRASAAQS